MTYQVEGLNLRPEHFEAATEILSSQLTVPRSPGLRKDNQNLLCAGAALVAAVLEAELSPEARRVFESAILADNGKQRCISDLRSIAGRDIAVANVLIANDDCDDSERKNTMIDLLSGMAETYRVRPQPQAGHLDSSPAPIVTRT